MISNASKLAASRSGSTAAFRRRVPISMMSCTSFTVLVCRRGAAARRAGCRAPSLPWSCGVAVCEADAGGDQAQVLVREPVAVLAQLPRQCPLAKPLAPRGSVLADHGGGAQQQQVRPATSTIRCAVGLAVWCAGPHWH